MKQRSIREVIDQRRLVCVGLRETVRAAALLMGREHLGALPIIEGGQLLGIFTERDALVRVLGQCLDPSRTTVGEVMTVDPRCIDVDQPLTHALLRMHEGGYRHMPVTENGVVVGMVSARDALGPELSQLDSGVEELERLAVQMR